MATPSFAARKLLKDANFDGRNQLSKYFVLHIYYIRMLLFAKLLESLLLLAGTSLVTSGVGGANPATITGFVVSGFWILMYLAFVIWAFYRRGAEGRRIAFSLLCPELALIG